MLTAEIAEAGWAEFQRIEAAGVLARWLGRRRSPPNGPPGRHAGRRSPGSASSPNLRERPPGPARRRPPAHSLVGGAVRADA